MTRTVRTWALGVVLLALTGCPSRSPVPQPDGRLTASNDDARVQTLWQERAGKGARTEPCLGPGDMIEISVFHWPDLQGFKTRISPLGTIALPLLGQVQAAGLTEFELRDRIADGLRRGYMRDPQVSV